MDGRRRRGSPGSGSKRDCDRDCRPREARATSDRGSPARRAAHSGIPQSRSTADAPGPLRHAARRVATSERFRWLPSLRNLAIASGLALIASACATGPFRFMLGPPACVAEWSDARAIPEHRGQRIRFVTQPLSAGPEEQRMRGELVTSAAKGELSVIGLTPFGTRAFSALQTGRTLELDAGIARRLGIEPYYLLDALHRGLWRSGADDGVRVERGDDGRLGVENPGCGYRTRFLVLPNENARGARPNE